MFDNAISWILHIICNWRCIANLRSIDYIARNALQLANRPTLLTFHLLSSSWITTAHRQIYQPNCSNRRTKLISILRYKLNSAETKIITYSKLKNLQNIKKFVWNIGKIFESIHWNSQPLLKNTTVDFKYLLGINQPSSCGWPMHEHLLYREKITLFRVIKM
jgi:hypothetical protein